MRNLLFYTTTILLILLFSCKSQKKHHQLHKMSEFNLENGYDFVSKIQYLQAINNISLVDTWTNGDFKVNNQTIFLDTIQQDKPNYYSYKKTEYLLR